MATFTIYDPPTGFVPKSHPKHYTVVKQATDGAAIKRFAPVILTGGYAVAFAYDDVSCAGIAMHHLDATPGAITDLIICDDPDQVYEVTADAAVAQTAVGKYCPMVTTPSSVNDHSKALLDISEAGVAASTKVFLIVGLVETVNGPTTKCLVKIVPPQLAKAQDATS